MKARILFTLCLAGAVLGAPAARAQAEIAAIPPERSEPSTSSAATLSQDQLLAKLGKQISEHFRLEGDLQLELLRPWSKTATVTDVAVIEFPTALTSSPLLRVRLLNADQTSAELSLPLRAQLLRDAWVTRQPVERNALFDSAMLDTRRVDVLRERDLLLLTDGQTDFAYARPVPAGHLITWHDVMRRELVHKGEVIEVAAIDGALTITMKALAMENGAAGDTVKVRNLVSKKDFAALVTGDSRAEVRF